jgi:hypothetical protein
MSDFMDDFEDLSGDELFKTSNNTNQTKIKRQGSSHLDEETRKHQDTLPQIPQR